MGTASLAGFGVQTPAACEQQEHQPHWQYAHTLPLLRVLLVQLVHKQ